MKNRSRIFILVQTKNKLFLVNFTKEKKVVKESTPTIKMSAVSKVSLKLSSGHEFIIKFNIKNFRNPSSNHRIPLLVSYKRRDFDVPHRCCIWSLNHLAPPLVTIATLTKSIEISTFNVTKSKERRNYLIITPFTGVLRTLKHNTQNQPLTNPKS